MGRLPEVGFVGRTPAAQHFGVAMCGNGGGSSSPGNRPFIIHNSTEPLKIPFAIAPGLRVSAFLFVDCYEYACTW